MDLDKLNQFRSKLKEIETFSVPFGIGNALDSFGHRSLQVALALGLKLLPKNTGNDLIDCNGTQYELKTINVKASTSYFAGVRISKNTLERFRSTTWLFAEFDNYYLDKVYKVNSDKLEIFFQKWELKLSETNIIIDQKIGVSKIRNLGELIFNYQTIKAPTMPCAQLSFDL